MAETMIDGVHTVVEFLFYICQLIKNK